MKLFYIYSQITSQIDKLLMLLASTLSQVNSNNRPAIT